MPVSPLSAFRVSLALAATAATVSAQTGQEATVDFARDVKPLLARQCLGCHNQKLSMSGLSLATREALLRGGKRGPGAVPGDPQASRLVAAVRHDGTLTMPPAKRLPDAEIAVLERWVRQGAAWPAEDAPAPPPKPSHWSFQAPRRPAEPSVGNARWVRTAIDRFILARLEKEGIAPSAEADRATLLRRVHLDLTGIPPTPAEVAGFLADRRPDAYERTVDRLLASAHYGERWGRLWLDLARYADSDGGSRDEPRPMWRYRDWVVRALNADQPFDRFVVEQLAGDLLPDPTPDQLVATGFHRNSPTQVEMGTDREQYRMEAVADRTDTTGTVFLGLSAGCARCHDHKFDPISHREYYQLFAFFNSTDDWGEDRPWFEPSVGNLQDVHRPLLEFSPPEQVTERDRRIKEQWDTFRRLEALKKESGEGAERSEEGKRLAAALRENKAKLPPVDAAMIQRELPEARATHVLNGGDYLAKGERVLPGTPSFLHPLPAEERPNRLSLARWLVNPENPLLARVTVNRMWQQYFGRGLVETENDFGTQGTPPTHPELLDWLATELVRTGWSQKAMHRLIATSAAYRQASRVRPELAEKDPRNLLLARQTRLRLDAEVVRDVALSAAGLLSPKVGGPSVFPPQPAGAMDASQVKKTWTPSTGEDRYRRGLYTFYWRVTPHPALAVFDAPNAMLACTRRPRSNTPLQALALLNEAAFHEFAQALARRVLREQPQAGPEARLRHAYRLTVAREPEPAETERLLRLLADERDALQTSPAEARALLGEGAAEGKDPVELAAWTSVARVLLNTDELVTRE